MRTKLVIAAVATSAAVSAVGASAYTNSITGAQDRYIGYGSMSITGATFHAQPTFTYSADATKIINISVVLNNDTSVSKLFVRRNTDNAEACDPASTDGPPVTTTTYSCTVLWDVASTTSIAYALQ